MKNLTTQLTIIVPTYNEYKNIKLLVSMLDKALQDIVWEVIFVDDDSPDGTAKLVRELAREDQRVKCIQRLGRRGLSSACIEGILASSSTVVCIMDADLQHDEKIIQKMYSTLIKEDLELVIGSRYIDAGSTGTMPRHRVWVSKFATLIGKLVLKQPVSDPMSGFFMLKRNFFEKIMRSLSGRGFKILLDILISSDRKIKLMEIPYTMRERTQGESKLSAGVIWEFFQLILEKYSGRIFPARFVSFVVVGLSGVVVHLIVLWFLHRYWATGFIPSQAVATLVAMTSNYILNNSFTFRDKKLRGIKFLRGLLSFYVACSMGAIINLSVATLLFEYALPWWFSGLMGAVAGAVWNYSLTATFTWSNNKDR